MARSRLYNLSKSFYNKDKSISFLENNLKFPS